MSTKNQKCDFYHILALFNLNYIIMWFILVCLLIIGLCILCIMHDEYAVASGVLGVFAVVLFLWLSSIPIARLSVLSEIEQFNAFKASIEVARTEEVTEYENAALTMRVAKWNEWLATKQNIGRKYFPLQTPKVVDSLEPIR